MDKRGDYIFRLDDDLCIDAENATHFSRYFNHAEHGTLVAEVDADAQRVDFYAARDVDVGEELTFDYGPSYWRWRDQPSAESDSRNFSDPVYRLPPPELQLRYPPAEGTVLPLTPLTAEELLATLALPEAEGRPALLRCLEYFGSERREDGSLRLRHGVRADAPETVAHSPDHATLQAAATACIVEALLDPADPSGEESRAFEAWLADADAELELIRRRRERVPRFASPRHDAVALATYLLWKNPGAHDVATALDKGECSALIGGVAGGTLEPDEVLDALAVHSSRSHVDELVARLQRWFELGDGCVVASVRPPRLAGAVTRHNSVVWDKAPTYYECGLLRLQYT